MATEHVSRLGEVKKGAENVKYNMEKMIETGRMAILRNPRRDITLHEYELLAHSGDIYKITERAFHMGIAVGMRLANAKQQKPKANPPA